MRPPLLLLLLMMMMMMSSSLEATDRKGPPHIIAIVADDMGWYDVGFHGSNQLKTPNIDALAYNGIILNNHYVQPLCTPSRAAFLTGKYPIHLGMQHSVLLEPEPRGLPLGEKLLPEYLQDAGYSTHAVGKWHLGFFRSEYTPTRRGFDTHYGYWNGFQDYYNHSVKATFEPSMIGHDLRRGMEVDRSSVGNYSTHLYTKEAVRLIRDRDDSSTKPMFLYLAHLAPHTGNVGNAFQAPDEEIAKFAHIQDPERRMYAAMVSALDRSVGDVVSALRQKNMLDNSIILFFSDNGAPSYGVHANRGSNYPLRGQKNGPWEGAVRGVATIWSPLFKTQKRIYNDMIHVSDWLPTLWSAIGRDPKALGSIDGMNVWEALVQDKPSPRTEIVLNIDPIDGYSSVRRQEWKLITNEKYTPQMDEWYGEYGHDDNTIYDTYDVLTSKAAISILGYITDRQIVAKYRKSDDFSMEPLTVSDVEAMRKRATLTCTNSRENVCDLVNSTGCLFNIVADPCETRNYYAERPQVVKTLLEMVELYKASSLPPANVAADPRSDPRLHDGEWTNWLDEGGLVSSIFSGFSPSALIAFKALCAVAVVGMLIVIVAQVRRWRCCTPPDEVLMERGLDHATLIKAAMKGANLAAATCPSVSVAKRVQMFERAKA